MIRLKNCKINSNKKSNITLFQRYWQFIYSLFNSILSAYFRMLSVTYLCRYYLIWFTFDKWRVIDLSLFGDNLLYSPVNFLLVLTETRCGG